MKLRERLGAEHGLILDQLEHLEGLLERDVDPTLLRGALALLWSGLEPHLRTEEELLYASLAEALGAEFGPLELARADHHELRRLARAAAAESAGLAAVEAFAALLRGHVAREETLVSLADDQLEDAHVETAAAGVMAKWPEMWLG